MPSIACVRLYNVQRLSGKINEPGCVTMKTDWRSCARARVCTTYCYW